MANIKLFLGDSGEVLKSLPDSSVDLIVTSPPYADQRKSTYGGITPKKYILNKRIDYAVFLLVTFNYNISEVAEKCGFADTKYFITTFKRATGFSPRQYVAQYPGAF